MEISTDREGDAGEMSQEKDAGWEMNILGERTNDDEELTLLGESKRGRERGENAWG